MNIPFVARVNRYMFLFPENLSILFSISSILDQTGANSRPNNPQAAGNPRSHAGANQWTRIAVRV